MDPKKWIEKLDDVPKKVNKHVEKKYTETNGYECKETVRFRKKKKKSAKKEGGKNMNWKYYLCVLIGILLSLAALFGGIWTTHKYFQKTAELKPQKNQSMDQVIKVCLYGNINSPEISPKSIKVKKNDIIAFYPPKQPVRRTNYRGKVNFVSFADVFIFSIPGKEGAYWLANTNEPTIFECPRSGYITFGISYPSLFSDFSTFIKIKEGYKMARVQIVFAKLKTKPKDYAEPRQIVRPKGLIGGLMPDFAIEKQKRVFDLREDSQKGLDDFLKRF